MPSPLQDAPVASTAKPGTHGFWTRRRKAWGAIGAASILVLSVVLGLVYFYEHQAGAGLSYLEVYVTDLPADFARLDVRVAGVYVGPDAAPLGLEEDRFDLLSLHGPDDALLVARGEVPASQRDLITIEFRSARALLNGVYVQLELPQPVLLVEHDFAMVPAGSSAVLFDLDVERSVVVQNGLMVFRPMVQAVYVHSYGADGSQGTSGGPGGFSPDDFSDLTPTSPDKQSLGDVSPGAGTSSNPFTSSTARPTTTTKPRFTWNQSPPSSSSPSPSPSSSPGPEATAPTEPILPDVEDVQSAPDDPSAIYGWFVRFTEESNDTVLMATGVAETGAQFVFRFASMPAGYIKGTQTQAKLVSLRPDVLYVEGDQPVVMSLASTRAAIRLPQLLDPLTGLVDGNGAPLDGRGIGVAMIDSGVDGTHPDLPHAAIDPLDPLLAANLKVESLFAVDLPNTDTTSGHGTHVAGILAGRGVVDPTQRGVAPGIQLYSLAIGEGSTMLWPNQALDWVVQNHARVDPPIRIVTNSWGSGNAYDPDSLTTKLVERLVDEGVVVVFAAGNAGGDGSIAATTSQCQIPLAGVICVAAYDDRDAGTRDGPVAPYSSRGWIGDPSTWPDLSAPGSFVRSTHTPIGLSGGIGLDAYSILSGTSMAAPHVSGVAALMLQAEPGLSPAQVESILESTAYKFADGGGYISGGNYAKGAGLVDAYAAVGAAQAA